MKDITTMSVALLFSNTLRLMCFAGLAVYFNRWWIVLLACLFWNSGKEKKNEEKDTSVMYDIFN